MDMKDDYVVVSQYDGILTEKFISEGDYVMPGSALFEVSDNSSKYVQAEVLDSDAITLEEGNDVDIIFEDFIYKGRIKKIYPKAYNKVSDLGIVQKRIKIDIEILDTDTKLILGQEVDVDFIVKKLSDVIRVKKEYVYDSDTKHFVLLLSDGIIEEREVTLGLEGEDYYEIQSGLSAGEQVITNLSEDITIGTKAELVNTDDK